MGATSFYMEPVACHHGGQICPNQKIAMTPLFDPLNIILLAIAIAVFWRLKSVLGSRTGTERPPADVTVLQPRKEKPAVVEQEPVRGVQDRGPGKPVWDGFAPEGSDLAKSLEAIAVATPGFSPEQFLEGAKRAYEMVLQAYADGDKAALKTLLGVDVLQSFGSAIDRRKADNAKFIFRFVGVNSAKLTRGSLDSRSAFLTVRFRSEMIQAVVASNGQVIEGDEAAVRDVEDVWTFERDIKSQDPNWKLAATDDDIG